VENKDKAAIVEEALELREELMGREYQDLIQAALAVRFSSDPVQRLAAIEALREDVSGATPNGSVSVTAALAKLRSRPTPAPWLTSRSRRAADRISPTCRLMSRNTSLELITVGEATGSAYRSL